MRKTVFIIFAAAVMLVFQSTVSADYIVKFKSDIRLMSVDTALTPLIPKLGLYTTDDISGIDMEYIEYAEWDAPVELFDSYDYTLYCKG